MSILKESRTFHQCKVVKRKKYKHTNKSSIKNKLTLVKPILNNFFFLLSIYLFDIIVKDSRLLRVYLAC